MLGRVLKTLLAPAAPPAGPPPQVHFIGHRSPLFELFGGRIADFLGGAVRGVVSDDGWRDYDSVRVGSHQVPMISLEDFRRRAEGARVELVHFYDDLDQFWALDHLFPGMRVVDFLAKLAELGLPHTYETVAAEHQTTKRLAARYGQAEARLGDRRSRMTLQARCETLLRLDRRPLLRARFPAEMEYFNPDVRRASLVLREDEIFVDVGAAHGDTVDKFVRDSGGRYERIYAFEPTAVQFASLEGRAAADPRIRVFQCAAGDTSGSIRFFENPANPFGSNAIAGSPADVATQVPCVRLDDVVERCTLLKLDVEGYECSVLRGAARLVRECRPNLAVTCYHYPGDLVEILDQVLALHPYRHVALRHYSTCLYDSVLLFSDEQGFEDPAMAAQA